MRYINSNTIIPLQNEEYYHYIDEFIGECKQRIWLSVFSVNVKYSQDENQRVRNLLKKISTLSNAGIDVRIIIGGNSDAYNDELFLSNEVSAAYLREISNNKISIKFFNTNKKMPHSHSKFVIIDDTIIIGSHNWSPRALSRGIDNSISIHNSEIANIFSKIYLKSWNKLIEYER